jgi:hypothetical protein
MSWKPQSLSDFIRDQAAHRDALCGDMLDWHARASGIVIPHIRAQQCTSCAAAWGLGEGGAPRARLFDAL